MSATQSSEEGGERLTAPHRSGGRGPVRGPRDYPARPCRSPTTPTTTPGSFRPSTRTTACGATRRRWRRRADREIARAPAGAGGHRRGPADLDRGGRVRAARRGRHPGGALGDGHLRRATRCTPWSSRWPPPPPTGPPVRPRSPTGSARRWYGSTPCGPAGTTSASGVVYRSDGHLLTTADAVDGADVGRRHHRRRRRAPRHGRRHRRGHRHRRARHRPRRDGHRRDRPDRRGRRGRAGDRRGA